MEPDRDTLNAFVDGELPPKEMERIAALLETRPDLNRYVQQQEQVRAALRQACALPETVPERLVQAVNTAPVSWRWRLGNLLGGRPLYVGLAGATAALALGVAIGFVMRPTADIGTDAAGRLVAQGRLATSLNMQLAANMPADAQPRIGISYRNKAGQDCRTFADRASAGLACHQDGAWVIGMLVRHTDENPHSAYRMAGSEMPAELRREVMDSIDGIPFDAAAEAKARARGWQGR
jgi:hypothetical protein